MKSIVKFSLIAALISSTSAFAAFDDLADLADTTLTAAEMADGMVSSTSVGAAILQSGDAAVGIIFTAKDAENLAIISTQSDEFVAIIDQSNATASKAMIIEKGEAVTAPLAP